MPRHTDVPALQSRRLSSSPVPQRLQLRPQATIFQSTSRAEARTALPDTHSRKSANAIQSTLSRPATTSHNRTKSQPGRPNHLSKKQRSYVETNSESDEAELVSAVRTARRESITSSYARMETRQSNSPKQGPLPAAQPATQSKAQHEKDNMHGSDLLHTTLEKRIGSLKTSFTEKQRLALQAIILGSQTKNAQPATFDARSSTSVTATAAHRGKQADGENKDVPLLPDSQVDVGGSSASASTESYSGCDSTGTAIMCEPPLEAPVDSPRKRPFNAVEPNNGLNNFPRLREEPTIPSQLYVGASDLNKGEDPVHDRTRSHDPRQLDQYRVHKDNGRIQGDKSSGVKRGILNGTGSKSSAETVAAMTEKLQLIINMGRLGSLRQAFELGLTATSSDKASQRLEWLLLSTLAPVLAVPAFSTVYSDVITALTSVGAALAFSENAHTAIIKSGVQTRTKAYFHVILGILKEITQFMNNATYPSTCSVKMSVFKSMSLHDHDPTWMTFRFAHVDDTLTVVSSLLSLFCHRSESAEWPVYKADDDQRIALLKVSCSLIDLFLPDGQLARSDRSGQRHLSASSASIFQLYQACGHCIKEAVSLSNFGYRYYPVISRSILEILHHHVMTLNRRCTEWNAGAASRTSIVKDYRKEVPAIASLEIMLAECLASVNEHAVETNPAIFESHESQFLAVSLLHSDQFLLLSDDESGRSVQHALFRIATAMIPTGFFEDPLASVDYILKNFVHLELGLLVDLVGSILEYVRVNEFGREHGADRTGPPKQPIHSTQNEQGYVMSSSKRAPEDIEYDQMQLGSLEWPGKRLRLDSQVFNVASLESAACSSIVSASQFSQWPGKQHYGGSKPWSPSEYLLAMLKKFTDNSAFSHTASQGPRGVQPHLSVNDLRAIIIILLLWTEDPPRQDTQGATRKAEELTGIVELIGKQYLRWVLSPGMHNASLNRSYLESSYPLVLDIVATVSTLSTNESFNELLICLSSGPWFTDISNKELWSSMPVSPSAHIDSISGERQLCNVLARVLERTAILTHLRDDPTLLQASESFLPQKCKAMLVMSTLPYCSQLAGWRVKVIIDTLKFSHNNPDHVCARGCGHSLTSVTIESLSVLSATSPNMEITVEAALGEGIEEDVLVTLASSMGVIACGVSTMERHALPAHSYDVMDQAIYLRRWLIRTCATDTSRLALLKGLYRVFCHLDLRGQDLRSVEFGKFMLTQLDDQNKDIREAAGDIVELLAQRVRAMLVDDPLAITSLDGSLARIGDSIARKIAGSLKMTRLAYHLPLCRRVMQHLPEDHPVYNRLLSALIDQVFAESSSFRSTLVLEEMAKIAKDKNLTHTTFLQPQNDLFCTQVIQKLDAGQENWLEILYSWTELGQKNFLKRNISGILPKLVILLSRELIEKVAALMAVDAGTLCIEHLDHIMAGILMHNDDGIGPPVELLRSLLYQAKPNGELQADVLGIAALITASKVGLLIRVSFELGHENPEVRSKAKKVIEVVEEKDWQHNNPSKRASERRSLATFLQQHILAVLSEINKAIMDTGQRITLGTKAKHLRSLSALVELLQPIQSTVLSQIISPLNMALNLRGLRIHALRALKSIIDLLEPMQFESLVGHLVQSLGGLYLNSNKLEQEIIFGVLDHLLVQSQDKLRQVLPDVGALPTIPDFEQMNIILQLAKTANGFEQQLQGLADRLGSEDSELARQAVVELREFLMANEERLLAMATSEDQEPNELLSNLVLTLLSEISRFRGLDAPVPMACAECLGIIGAIDPDRISGRRTSTTTTVYANLNDLEESRNFVCELIAVQLVGKSRSIGDVPSESHWAFTLQELLSFCGITKDVLETEPAANLSSRISQRNSGTPKQSYYVSTPAVQPPKRLGTSFKMPKERWRDFPRHVQEVLELLIDAKYKKTETSTPPEQHIPLYPYVKTFQEWLTRWTLSLTAKVIGRNAKDVFQACKHVIPYDTATSLYILPHLVLHVLLEGSERDQREIVNEMAAVLGDGHDLTLENGHLISGLPNQSMSELHQLGSQTAFVLLDHITKWIQQRRNSRTRLPGNQRTQQDPILQTVQNHLMSISHELIVNTAFRGKAYARALFHSEQHIRDSKPKMSEMGIQGLYEEYQQLYVWMDEPDGMEGISSLITSGTLPQHLLQCESAGRWEEAHAYHELGVQTEPSKLDHHVGLYRALDNLGQYDTLLNGVEGDIYAHPAWEESLNDFRISTSWKSQRWESLEESLSRSLQSSFDSGLGLLMKDMRENRVADFEDHLRRTRSMLIAPLAAAGMESYSRAYDRVAQLHMLHELEVAFHSWNRTISSQCSSGSQIALKLQSGGSYTERVRLYQPKLVQRLELMAPSFKMREQVSLLRRIAFYHIRIQDKDILDHEDVQYLTEECGRLWLESARAARKSNNDQLSYSAMLHAEDLGNTSAVIERVKWGFSHNNERQAIKTIDSALKRNVVTSVATRGTLSRASSLTLVRPKSSSSSTVSSNSSISRSGIVFLNTDLSLVQDRVLDKDDRGFIRAKAILLRTRWMDKSSLVSPGEISEGFRDAAAECDVWDKLYYAAGQFFFKLYENSKRKNRPQLTYASQGCRLYSKALSLGPKYLYQIMPRLLTHWLDLGRRVHVSQANPGVSSSELGEFRRINELMNALADHLPEYMFLSAFPQIISRICHKNPDAFFALQRIIANVVLAYPDQAIWQMVSVSRSVVQERKRVCNKILHTIQQQPVLGPAIIEQVTEALDLCDSLIELCKAPVKDRTTKLSLERDLPHLALQLKRSYNVIIPGQRNLWPSLPKSSETMASHRPFKSNLPKIDRFLDEVDVMTSLQKPRKVTAVGSDGVYYTFLCKPKDDLRKDAKVMEFNSLVNTLLKKDREANRRDLYIRTYAVVPLNEEYGLIEWIHNTAPYRLLVHKLYRLNNIAVPSNADIKRILDHEDHVRLFVKELVPKFPSVFYQWFKEIAPEPTAWFAARLRFTRTAAVMSMAGYIVGLGDRHGENLMLDELNGDVVHVDFNCLFDAGKTFPKPERVPFRLTHNMVDGMGLSGYDGTYRLACEKTLGVFRDNFESLMSILEGFVHDPLVEWSNSRKKSQQREATGAMVGDDTRTRLMRGARADPKAAAAVAEAGTADGEPYDEQQAEKAKEILGVIRRKLNGLESQNGMFSLSVVGQVEELIQNATTPENLGKMYIGWSAYL
ncbi:serine/threonine-protein kinase M1 [Linnemannia hyalina]|uniref:non-specific serine/threonine protein kinase n=1 Tax=Linnemannia hyalina TaxID=64524 RepID=A0A9P8BSQ4_9FUNG|nr:serine/threonine-protein kinase M1 [Linnemannia hyalina]